MNNTVNNLGLVLIASPRESTLRDMIKKRFLYVVDLQSAVFLPKGNVLKYFRRLRAVVRIEADGEVYIHGLGEDVFHCEEKDKNMTE